MKNLAKIFMCCMFLEGINVQAGLDWEFDLSRSGVGFYTVLTGIPGDGIFEGHTGLGVTVFHSDADIYGAAGWRYAIDEVVFGNLGAQTKLEAVAKSARTAYRKKCIPTETRAQWDASTDWRFLHDAIGNYFTSVDDGSGIAVPVILNRVAAGWQVVIGGYVSAPYVDLNQAVVAAVDYFYANACADLPPALERPALSDEPNLTRDYWGLKANQQGNSVATVFDSECKQRKVLVCLPKHGYSANGKWAVKVSKRFRDYWERGFASQAAAEAFAIQYLNQNDYTPNKPMNKENEQPNELDQEPKHENAAEKPKQKKRRRAFQKPRPLAEGAAKNIKPEGKKRRRTLGARIKKSQMINQLPR